MELRETTLSFPITRGSGPRTATATMVFPRQVLKATAALRGYQVGFVGDDHHVGQLRVELATEVNANVVVVHGQLGCRDWSGHWDDEYNGSIQVGVLCELASASAPPPRGDLQIIDLEVNQATQFFRSAEHLDAANVMPDNSLPLVGGKATGLRFYVDHDAAAGAPIGRLSGQVTLRSGGASTTLAPLAVIVPRRATEIERSQVDHTLNFAIPAAWCRGQLEVACEVFAVGNPTARSAAFRRTLSFVDVNPLRVYGVGINYTGAGLNLAAPTQADLLSTLDYTRSVWPTGDVLASGFTTLTFGDDLSGVAADGCGSGFNSLLDRLRDLRGDTDDLVYGLLPNGTPLTGVAGCGGDGVGSGMVGDGVTAAHEAGHAFGRQHAPCDDSARCDSPRNADDDFPLYGNYNSDSAGEFGFDPVANAVFDPATASDFMGYSGNNWISPYTYRHLFSKGDPVGGAGSARLLPSEFAAAAAVPALAAGAGGRGGRPEWIKRRQPLLMLSLWADDDRLTLRPSFTMPAYLRRRGVASAYEVHLLGKGGELLACVPLQQACGACDNHCGPAQLAGEVPWHDDAAKLVVRREGRDVGQFPVEPKPRLTARARLTSNGDVHVSWSADSRKALWYLVQWGDRDDTWRGVAPRLQGTELVIPGRMRWATKGRLKLRVLAVAQLNTAMAECDVEGHDIEPPNDLVVRELPGGRVVRATLVDATGRSLPARELAWYDEQGDEIAAGSDLVRDGTRAGMATVRQVAQGVAGIEGFAPLDAGSGGEPRCGCLPPGAAAKRLRGLPPTPATTPARRGRAAAKKPRSR